MKETEEEISTEEEEEQEDSTEESTEETQVEEQEEETQETEEESEEEESTEGTESEEESEEQEQEGQEEEESEEENSEDANAVKQTATPDVFTEKLASLMEELRKKDVKIEELESKIHAFEIEKRESVLLSKVESYINDKKILPKNKDEIFNLLKTMTDEQVDQFFKITEKNTAYPSGEKGQVPTPGAHSEEDDKDENEENEAFFT